MQPTSNPANGLATAVENDELPRSLSSTTQSGTMRSTKWTRMMSSRSLSWVASTSAPVVDVNQPMISNGEQGLMDRTGSSARRALDGLRFINRTTSGSSEMWAQVAERFDKLKKDGLLARDDFGQCIGMESTEFARAIFDVLARRMNQRIGKINKHEMEDFWKQLANPSFDARLRVFFDMVDNNGDGKIDRNEIQELIVLSASANKLGTLIERAQEYANLIMDELDTDGSGTIELSQLEGLLLRGDVNKVKRRQTTSLPRRQKITSLRLKDVLQRVYWLIRNYWRRAWIIFLWLMAMTGLFVWKFEQYRKKEAFHIMGYCLCTAKGAAETLKLNMALILLAMCRNTLTFLRSTWVGFFIPFNDNLNFHKMMGLAIVIGVVLHAGNHLACDFPRLVNSSPENFKLIASDFNNKKPTYVGLLTGIEGVTGITMVVLMTISFALASVHFRNGLTKLPFPFKKFGNKKALWYTHYLHCLVYVLLVIHGTFLLLAHRWNQKTTWMYISFPILVFIAETALRCYRSRHYSTDELEAFNLPCNVFTIRIPKPENFEYRSGQYIFIQCPTISKFQWRPFSLTSAPGDDKLSVHIRTNGSWTCELNRILTDLTAQNLDHKCSLKLIVDGPYGAPAQDYTNYDVLLLLGLGIGATPFISILRDLLNHKREEQIMDRNSNTDASSSCSSAMERMRVRKAHFYWVTKEHASLEWFKGVMDELEEMAQEGFIDVHNYLTGVYGERDARSTLITMINDLNHRKNGVDILSCTWVKTHFGRPNWNEVFTTIADKHPGCTVGVFYCGDLKVAKGLKTLAHEMSRNTSTRFKFHKENF